MNDPAFVTPIDHDGILTEIGVLLPILTQVDALDPDPERGQVLAVMRALLDRAQHGQRNADDVSESAIAELLPVLHLIAASSLGSPMCRAVQSRADPVAVAGALARTAVNRHSEG